MNAQIVVPEGGFRTQEQDEAEVDVHELGTNLPVIGATKIPIKIDKPGRYTIGIYHKEGRLIRILGQALELSEGTHEARWDGMDVYGHMVKPGTPLEVKVIRSPGVSAYYEFAIGQPNERPWGGKFGGEVGTPEMRMGGWLGDHGTPNGAIGVGDYVMVSTGMAEYGNSLTMIDMNDNIIWTMDYQGWDGPSMLREANGRLFGLGGGITEVPLWKGFNKGGRKYTKRLFSPRKDKVRHFAVHNEEFLALTINHETKIKHYRRPRPRVNNAESQPQVLGTTPPTPFMISAQSAFNGILNGNPQPQVGTRMITRKNRAYVVYAFNNSVSFGSIRFSKMPDASKIEVYSLSPDITEYDSFEHSPLREREDEDALAGLELNDLDENWIKIGEVTPNRNVNFLVMKDKLHTTKGLYFVAHRPKEMRNNKKWHPHLRHAQLLTERIDVVPAKAQITLPKDKIAKTTGKFPAHAPGWNLRTKEAVSALNQIPIILDYKKPMTFDGLVMFNPVNGTTLIERFIGNGDPETAPDSDWELIGKHTGNNNRKLGSRLSAKFSNTRYIELEDRTTTRALRFTVQVGFKTGKWASLFKGEGKDNPFRVETDEVLLIRRVDNPPKPKQYILKKFNIKGDEIMAIKSDDVWVDTMDYGDDGTLYTVQGNKLMRSQITSTGFKHTVLNEGKIARAGDMQARNGRIAVADRDKHCIWVFDTSGNLIQEISNGKYHARQIGKWDPYTFDKPVGVGIDKNNGVWVADSAFQPKRIARFDANGKFIKDYYGNPRYGGGGILDPNLKYFYYRGVRHVVDFEKGTSFVDANFDRPYRPETIGGAASTYSHSSVEEVIYLNGNRYLVGNAGGGVFAITILNDDDYKLRPCVVMGAAENSTFLLRKELWMEEFIKMDLADKYFVWQDYNDDGDYQREELKIYDADHLGFTNKEGKPFFPWNGEVEKDLGIWHWGARIKPDRFTPGGVPIYDVNKWERWQHKIPVLHSNLTVGGSSGAKPYYFGFRQLTSEGYLIYEGQPFAYKPDGSPAGGMWPEKNSNFQPEISGFILDQPWKYAGSEPTDSQIGEVAIVNSNNGYWYVWSPKYGVLIDTFFDGTKGEMGETNGPSHERGTDVTHYKQGWESWGASFVKAHNGKFYVIGGKGWHGVYRLEGLNDFEIETYPLNYSVQMAKNNANLREVVRMRAIARHQATSRKSTKKKDHYVKSLRERTVQFNLDGAIEDWGDRNQFESIGDPRKAQLFDITHDDKGIYIALSGENRLGNNGKNWETMFNTGFSFEILIRTDERNQSRDLSPGDIRIVFSKYKGEWIAVAYDYRGNKRRGKSHEFNTPLAISRVADMRKLTPRDIQFHVNDRSLGINLDTLDQLDDDFGVIPGETGESSADGKNEGRKLREGYDFWTAEIFIPRSYIPLRIGYNSHVRFDVAISNANKAGNGVESRDAWSDISYGFVGDPALENSANPGAWGYVRPPFKSKIKAK